ncbi:MAG: radical SAM family heme chaperone HemW [Acidobacteriota bacterium]|nr:radical SAM family heme chaperone HemW [Acidobacteriota bacterium]
MTSVGIYVQVPFCQTKCTYCNFHTGVVASSRFAPYVQAVCREIENHADLYTGAGIELPLQFAERARPDTVYIGGGTPSLLDPEHLQNILDTIRATFSCALAEITLEADPETIDPEKAAAWVRAGIHRVSFGVQSFSDKELVASGRMHRQADIYRAVPILRKAGIANIGFDLIAGLPLQTSESWRDSLERLTELAPEHISVYMLEVDEKSRLGSELLKGGQRYSAGAVPPEDEMAEFYELAQAAFRAAGYHHYEISNWAKPGFESRHNLKYWRREPYLGFGAGAHSFSGTQRWANAHDAADYVGVLQRGSLPVEQLETLSSEAALEEELFLGLRQLDGINVSRIEKDYAVKLASRFDPLASSGLVEWNGPVVRLAPSRLSVSNEVFVELLR